MQEDFAPKKPKSLWKVKALAAIVPLTGLVMAASAAELDLNATIGPILDSVITLIPSILNLILAIVPVVVVMAVVGFILMFFDKILAMLKF